MLPVVESAAMASRSIIDVSWFDLAWAGGLMLIAVGISHWQKLGLAQRLVIGAHRTVVQLMLVGYALVYIFALDRWYLVGVALLGMLLVATKAAVNRQFRASRTLLMITGVAMLLASGLTLLYISTLVVRVTPWYNPQYLIPLFGMIIGSAMNAAAIAAERLASEIAARTAEIEAYLALSATAQQGLATTGQTGVACGADADGQWLDGPRHRHAARHDDRPDARRRLAADRHPVPDRRRLYASCRRRDHHRHRDAVVSSDLLYLRSPTQGADERCSSMRTRVLR
jgi:putative ABC transport system permease protein